MRELLKQTLVVLASACVGFYLGGRYTGSLVQTEYVIQKPNWMLTAQGTMWAALLAAGVCVLAWIILDYTGTSS
jgi:hypothetical protein